MCVHIPKQYVVSFYLSLHTYQWKHTMCVLILFPSLNIMVLRFIYWMHVAVVDSFSLLCCIRYEYNPAPLIQTCSCILVHMRKSPSPEHIAGRGIAGNGIVRV